MKLHKKQILLTLCSAKFAEYLDFGRHKQAVEIAEIVSDLGFKNEAGEMYLKIQKDNEIRK